ncbi:MAG: DUF1743 domain-containing protein [Nitrososphaeria archaeon]|nr:DUF1743 domain-containing protein [Nitrososphaeria archaeon]NIN53034.1 DUF1743 domain-containing protein [Nitrososphaeria archaeon]NIQ33621.1 DUF1743 domain-containing protein [Nitrososphaeria archaeon]
MPILHIGLDDTDSKEGMCTTYIGAVIVDKLVEGSVKLVDYPHLIRLNPNWTLKTRGNCAIAFIVDVEDEQIPAVNKMVLETVTRLAELHHESTNPGVVFYRSTSIPKELRSYSRRVIQDVVTIEEAVELAKTIGAEVHRFKLGRGVVGALAAIGEVLEQDRTFELIAYRVPKNWGMERRIDEKSVFALDAVTYPETFDNLDPSTREIRITPHTPCPLLYGIRAQSPGATFKAHRLVRALEPIERWVIYKTNQATDAHLRSVKINKARPLRSAIIKGMVSRNPKVIPGGHVILRIRDESGEIDCAAYEPTRKFREVAKALRVGDLIRAYGGVKKKACLPLTLNLEKVEVLQLSPILKKINPICTGCDRRTKSAGRNKGYVCKRCRRRFPEEQAKLKEESRDVKPGLYEVPPRARRHLAKPLVRIVNNEEVS